MGLFNSGKKETPVYESPEKKRMEEELKRFRMSYPGAMWSTASDQAVIAYTELAKKVAVKLLGKDWDTANLVYGDYAGIFERMGDLVILCTAACIKHSGAGSEKPEVMRRMDKWSNTLKMDATFGEQGHSMLPAWIRLWGPDRAMELHQTWMRMTDQYCSYLQRL